MTKYAHIKRILAFFWGIEAKQFMLIIAFCISGFVLFLFAKRSVFPDISFDTINYHFFLGKSGIENFPKMFSSHEFFPLGMHSFNPLLDSINYLIYEQIGYRLGTALSALALLGSFALSDGIVFRVSDSSISRIAAVFLIPTLVVNEGLFQVATYFTDNIYAFLVLVYVYVLLGFKTAKSTSAFVWQFFTLGSIFGLLSTKLTNVIVIIPLFIATAYIFLIADRKHFVGVAGSYRRHFAVPAFMLPALVLTAPYFYEAFKLTANPVFPYYNSIFNSVFYPRHSWAFDYGPTSFVERVFYPYFALFNPNLLGQVKDLYPDVKLITTFGFIVIAFAAVLLRKIRLNENENILLLVSLGGFVGWQLLFGYSRYAIALEMLMGLSAVILVNRLIQGQTGYLVGSLIVAYASISLWQSFTISQFNLKYDIAWRTSNISYDEWKNRFLSSAIFEKETKYSLEVAKKLKNVDVVVQCVNPSSAYFKTFPDLMGKPMLNFDKGWNGLMTSNENYIKKRDESALDAIEKKGADYINFAIVLNGTNSKKGCLDALDSERKQGRVLSIDEVVFVDNFVGDTSHQLLVFLGKYHFP